MQLPNKVTSYKFSILSRFPIVLSILEEESLSPERLYSKVKNKIDIIEFLEVLDCLFVLGRIDFDNDLMELSYVDGNKK